ncbi:hypothetical protein GGI07_002537 [Coemansia sp. Benny D115]|nr:hypothetical protein GGI07_002537 [Coemansia sp. Benny D115]
MSKVIAIVGSTGLQGGSVLKALYGKDGYTIRALTRDPDSAPAKNLKTKYPDVELVKANVDKIDSLRNAFKGADLVFGMTTFVLTRNGTTAKMEDHEAEFRHGMNIVDAAIAEGVSSLIFSSLDSMDKISNGKYPNVSHLENKNKVEQYILSKAGTIRGYFVYAGFYMENYVNFSRISPEDNSTVEFTILLPPDTELALVDVVNDMGGVVEYIVDNPEECLGKVMEVSGGYYKASDMVDAFTSATGKPARYVQLPPEIFGSEELTQMFKGMIEFGSFGGRTEFVERNKRMDYKFTTPTEFWKNRGWTGPTQ